MRFQRTGFWLLLAFVSVFCGAACRRQSAPAANHNDAAPAQNLNANLTPDATPPMLPANVNNLNAPAPSANVSNRNAPAVSVNANNAPAPTVSSQTIPAREPEQYRATLTLKLNGAARPAVVADVARNGTDRRWDFTLSDGTRLTYLYQTDRLFIILPDKKIYAEQEGATEALTLPATLDPERLTQQLRADNRYRAVGATQFKQRTADKYQYLGGAESFVLLDKETGLPLRVELAQPAANGQNIVTAIELQPSAAPIPLKHFNEPRDFQPVAMAQIADAFRRLTQTAAGAK